ncbi:MAG: hypothetical protein ACFFFC_05940 [Candidatus Thorarchaeota archaeon]
MKKKPLLKISAIMLMIAITFGAASSAIAFPNNTEECGLCHTNTGVIGLTSNATETVNTTVGDSFTLLLDADNGVGAISIRSGWADNTQFIYAIELVEDDDGTDTNGNVGEISFAVDFTGRRSGNFTIRIWAASTGLYSTSLDVPVEVHPRDTGTNSTTTTIPTTPSTPTTDPEQVLIETWWNLFSIIVPGFAIGMAIIWVIVMRRLPNR